jgi:WD40 repeat protein
MLLRSRWNIVLLALPVVLFGILWKVVGKRPKVLPGIGGSATTIAYSPDGKILVCASSNNFVQQWMPELKRWRSFEGSGAEMSNPPLLFQRLCFSPDGKTLYAGGVQLTQFSSSFANAWDTANRQRKFRFNQVYGFAFDVSPDGHWAAMSEQNNVSLVDLHGKHLDWSGKPIPPHKEGVPDFQGPHKLPARRLKVAGNVTCVAFSPDSKTLVVGSENFQWHLAFWNVQTGKQVPVTTSAPSFGVPSFLEWSPDGKRVAAVGASKIVIYDMSGATTVEVAWPTSSAPLPPSLITGAKDAAHLAWSPDGQWLFSGGDEVRQWRAADLKLWRSFGVSGPVAVAPDGKTLATANRPGADQLHGVALWKIE